MMNQSGDIVVWLREAPSDEWCGPMLNKAANEIERLRKWQEHGGLLRDAVESIGVGGAQMTPREATLRGQCRLLVKAFDEGIS